MTMGLTSHETDMTNDLLRQCRSPVRCYPLPGERVIFTGGNDLACIVSAETFRRADGWLEFFSEDEDFGDPAIRLSLEYGRMGIRAPGAPDR